MYKGVLFHDIIVVLTVSFEFPGYSPVEGTTQVVCLTVISGVLASGATLSIQLSTSPGNTAGKVKKNKNAKHGTHSLPLLVMFEIN